jgi:hypothetical protein
VPSAALTVSPQGLAGLIDGIVIGRPDITSGGFTSLSLSISDISDGHALIQAIKSAGTEWGDLVLNANGGNVGIGTTISNAKLTVDPQGAGGILIGNPSITPQQGGGTLLELNISAASEGFANIQATRATFLIEGIPKPAPGVLAINANGGNVGIGTTTPDAKLTVNGDVSVTGDVILKGADCAEEFDIAGVEEIEPGTVMVIDQDGILQQSQYAYDKRVAGIVSGAGGYRPGLILDKQQSQDNRIPIALVGKVYCRVDAQYAPIEVGDLLTTSSTSGHAMKADDPLKAFGSVIGKALSSLDQGCGLIPILVALQ